MPGRACDQCGQLEGEGVVLKRCAKCQRELYCSRACQAAAWPKHKQTCGRLLIRGVDLALPPEEVPCDLPEPARGEWRFGRPMPQPQLELPFPLTREGFEACLPQLLKFVEWTYNDPLTAGGRRSAEASPPHGIFLSGVRRGQLVPGGRPGERATRDETRLKIICLLTEGPPVEGGTEKERFVNIAMQNGINSTRAQAALFMWEECQRAVEGGSLRVIFEGVVVVALFPGLRRCFQLDMLAGGRRGGQLVRVEPAVETSGKHAGMVFRSKHPRFYPAP